MVIVNLKGGTGNQLFQYALGRHLAIKNNTELKLDISGLDRANKVGDIYRPFALEAFNVVNNLANAEEIKRIKYPHGLASKVKRYISFKLTKDKNTLFHPTVLMWKGDIYLDGYWQSPLYFNDIREILLKEFTLTEPFVGYATELATKMRGLNSVSIHIRRGDYVQNSHVLKLYGMCSINYYQQAIATVREKVTDPIFFVFSDDIDWVKENLPLGKSAIYVEGEGLTDKIELMLMSICKHNIIANSSFSWWGAWLNQNPKKIVVAPDPWFNNTVYDSKLIPSDWLTLPK